MHTHSRLIAATLAAGALAACTTTADLRKQPPISTHTSNRSAVQVATCITERWERGWFGSAMPVEMRQAPDGFTVLIRHPTLGQVDYLADVTATGSGSAIRYHRLVHPNPDPKDQDVVACI